MEATAVMVALADVPRAESRPPSAPALDAAHTLAPDEGRPDGDLPAALRDRCAAVIDAEVTRLARRTALDCAQLAIVTGALHRLADSLLLERVRAGHCEPSLLAALFDLETTC
ncbi:hypothetical protein SAMN04489712_11032 [Thermomonospora echinospora]|uniref:Uncharacterized protein n=1 Tax=Thermomonospora echinospora TaxID=1992 RepID=A0A1H6CIL9_9ACTN|nr:hypothetical protein [Thermomonospora echinospora]SEG72758.1 hypothetical protein SAMN04489712_11032 [Thermomonospora echinospora]